MLFVVVAGRRAGRRQSGGGAGRAVWCRRSGTAPDAGASVAVLARDAGDQAVEAQPAQVVAGLVRSVVGAVEQSGHHDAQALVGDAGDGKLVVARAPARAWTRGSPNLRAGALLPSWLRVGREIRSKAGLAKTQPWPTRSGSISRPLIARALASSSSRCATALTPQIVGCVDHGLDPQGPAVLQVLLDPGVLVKALIVTCPPRVTTLVLNVSGWVRGHPRRSPCR